MSRSYEPTPAEERVLDELKRQVAVHKQPTSDSVGFALGITRQAAHEHLTSLKRKGWLRLTDRRWELVGAPDVRVHIERMRDALKARRGRPITEQLIDEALEEACRAPSGA